MSEGMGTIERRRFDRRIKSIRFRFHADGEEQRAVTTTVSPGGAFLKASYVPPVGTTVLLRELYNHGAPEILVRGEVRWTIPSPTLARPNTGFGMAFLELLTRDDPSALEDFLRYLDPDTPSPAIQYEERADGIYAVYRFPAGLSAPPPDAADDGPLDEEPAAIDLERELARLAQESRGEEDALARPEAPTARPARGPRRPRPRSRRRSVTGLFTALFARRRADQEPGFDEGREAFQTPARPGRGASSAGAADGPRAEVVLSWERGSVRAAIDALEPDQALLRSQAATAPGVGARVRLTPLGRTAARTSFELQGQVEEVEADGDGAVTLTVRYERPRGGAGEEESFARWLRVVRGPQGG